MPKVMKPAKEPGTLRDDFLEDLTRPPATAEAEVVASGALSSASPSQGISEKRQPSRVSKHHVSLYVDPAVDRAFKRLALDQERKTWEVYHDALRLYLKGKGYSFDDLMTGKAPS